ncbi:hypothetical protein LNTAR_11876 [Lentisphaera araneosa HTCC2155]|uniref:Uncharacterized protein n=1 Tax=Lentisphaera araneosa HTCC2155 TaxID=313628 RepID=A6DJH6_9BACT|nr:hypothetical protein [Lentisphaera araneosa]EDM28050.1 hypothetical protein LNTAR_11876 [Lentisphaera araneosa HTCC2155]
MSTIANQSTIVDPRCNWTSFSTINSHRADLFKKQIKKSTGQNYTPLSESINTKCNKIKKFRCYRYIKSKIRFFLIELSENVPGKIKILQISPFHSWKKLTKEFCQLSNKVFLQFIKDTHYVKYLPLGHDLEYMNEGTKFNFSCIALMNDLEDSPLPLKLSVFQDSDSKLHFLQIDHL